MKKSFLGILFIVLFSGIAVQLDAAAQSLQEQYEASLNEGFDWLAAQGYQIIEGTIGTQQMQRGWLNNSRNLINAMNFIGRQVFESGAQSPRRSQSPRRKSGSGPERTVDPRGRGYDERKGFVGGKESSFDLFSIFNSPQPNSNLSTVGMDADDMFSGFSDLAGGSTSGSSSVDFRAFPLQDVGFQSGEAEGKVESDSFFFAEPTAAPEVVGPFNFFPGPLNEFLGSGKK